MLELLVCGLLHLSSPPRELVQAIGDLTCTGAESENILMIISLKLDVIELSHMSRSIVHRSIDHLRLKVTELNGLSQQH